jgi:hypothetical protein
VQLALFLDEFGLACDISCHKPVWVPHLLAQNKLLQLRQSDNFSVLIMNSCRQKSVAITEAERALVEFFMPRQGFFFAVLSVIEQLQLTSV